MNLNHEFNRSYLTAAERIQIYLLMAIFGFGIFAATPRANSLKSNLNVNNQLYGVLVTLGAIGASFGFIYSGKIVQKFGSQKVLFLSATLLYGFYATIPHIHIWWLYLIINISLGFAISGYNAASFSLVVAREVETKQYLMARFQGSWSIGVLLTSLLAYLIAPYISFACHVDTIAGISWLLTMLIIYRLKESFSTVDKDETSNLTFTLRAIKESISLDYLLVAGFTCGVFMEFVAGDWTTLVMHQEFKSSITTSIGIYFLFVLAMIIGRMSAPFLINHNSEKFWLLIATLVGGSTSLIGFETGHLMVHSNHNLALILESIGFFFGGLGTSIISPIFSNAVVRRSPEHPAQAISKLWFTHSVINTILRLCFSAIVGISSISTSLVIPAVLLIGSSFFVSVAQK